MSDQSNTRFFIRNLHYNDIPELVNLPRIEGREMGQESEIATWMEVDPEGIFVLIDRENGCIAGCCSGIALSDYHGYIGMYVVENSYRGRGLGKHLWDAAINHLGDRNISLSSADKMLPIYRDKNGFTVSVDWTVDLYTTTQPVLPASILVQSLPFTFIVKPDGPFVQNVIHYDFSIHKYDRSAIVRETIKEPGNVTVMSVELSLGLGLRTTGYACIKRSLQNHWMIAPVYAENYRSAMSLVYSLLSTLTDIQRSEGVVTKLVSSNHEAIKLFYQFGLRKSSYSLRRLFTKEVFEIPETKIFALQTSVFCSE